MQVSSPTDLFLEMHPRFGRLPRAEVGGLVVPVAIGVRARLFGLAHLDQDRAGPGLLIPRCSAVHTFGMRFALDLRFLGEDGSVLLERLGVPPRRVASLRGAAAVLETPAQVPLGAGSSSPTSPGSEAKGGDIARPDR